MQNSYYKMSKENKAKELATQLWLYYQAGLPQDSKLPRMVKVEDGDGFPSEKECRKFRKFVDREAIKRKLKPRELVYYFSKHRKELLQCLKEDSIKLRPSRFPTIYKNSEMEKFTQEIFITRRPQNIGLKGGYETWEGKNVQYLIPVEEVFRLRGKDPKVYVSQLKNISLLLAMVQEQQYNETNKEPVCEFSKAEYARRRGRTEEQIKRGGKIFEEDRRDYITGAITTYKIDNIEINGKKYTRYGIPNFYLLDEPDNPKDNIRVSFYNEPYKTYVVDILNGNAKPFFQEDPKAIEDRYTDQHPYLFLFYLQLVKRKQSKSLLWWRVKIIDVLKEMGVNQQILARPKECFRVLKECLVYFSNHYEPTPEIESFRISKVSQRAKSSVQPLSLSVSEGFKNMNHKEFVDLLKEMGISDLRKAYISIKRYPASRKRSHKLNDQETEILNRTLKWFEGKITKIPQKDQKSLITIYIKKLGYDTYESLFEREQNKWTNPIEFLKKVLPHHPKNPGEPITQPSKEANSQSDKQTEQPADNRLINRIISWAYEHWNIKKPKTEVRDYLTRAREKMGHEKLEKLFNVEGNKYSPNGAEFLFTVLPQYMKDPQKPIIGSGPKKITYVN